MTLHIKASSIIQRINKLKWQKRNHCMVHKDDDRYDTKILAVVIEKKILCRLCIIDE